jgi:hypothetical protein
VLLPDLGLFLLGRRGNRPELLFRGHVAPGMIPNRRNGEMYRIAHAPNRRLFPRFHERSKLVPYPLPHPRSATQSTSGSRRCRVAALPHRAAASGGGRSRSRFLQTAPEGTTPARSRRPSRKGNG